MADQQDERERPKSYRIKRIKSDALLPFEGDGRLIRRQWHDRRWFLSVVDVVAALTDSTDPGNYWSRSSDDCATMKDLPRS